MIFFCSRPGKSPNADPLVRIIAGPAWVTVRDYASRLLGGDEGLIVHQTGEDAVPDVELRLVGTDAGEHGGGPNGRRMQVRERERVGSELGPWRDDVP
jgi:hypothetical protein